MQVHANLKLAVWSVDCDVHVLVVADTVSLLYMYVVCNNIINIFFSPKFL